MNPGTISLILGLIFIFVSCYIFWDTRADNKITFYTYLRQHGIIKRINSYALTLLVVSGILFWTFIIMNFVTIPYENTRFMMLELGFLFWLYQVPFDAMAMLFFICLFLLAELIERRKRRRNSLPEKTAKLDAILHGDLAASSIDIPLTTDENIGRG